MSDMPQNRPVEIRPYVLGRTFAHPTTPRDLDSPRRDRAATWASTPRSAPAHRHRGSDPGRRVRAGRGGWTSHQPDSIPDILSGEARVLPRVDSLFDIGLAERVQLFYSRRLGLDSFGAPVPIVASRVCGGQVHGLSDCSTFVQEAARRDDITLQVGRDMFDRSTAAGVFVDRSAPGDVLERGSRFDFDFRSSYAGTTWTRTSG